MPLRLSSLDAATRPHLLAELDHDVGAGRAPHPPELPGVPQDAWIARLRAALATGDPDALSAGLVADRLLADGAAMEVSEREFHRYFVRGLCRRAVAENVPWLEVYRARTDREPPDAALQAMVRLPVDPLDLLLALRGRGAAGVAGLSGPGRPMLSVRLPPRQAA